MKYAMIASIVILAMALTALAVPAHAERQPYQWPPADQPSDKELQTLRNVLRSEYLERNPEKAKELDDMAKARKKHKEEESKTSKPSNDASSSSGQKDKDKDIVNPFETPEKDPNAPRTWSQDDVKRYCVGQSKTQGAYDNCLSRNGRRIGRVVSPYDTNLIDPQ